MSEKNEKYTEEFTAGDVAIGIGAAAAAGAYAKYRSDQQKDEEFQQYLTDIDNHQSNAYFPNSPVGNVHMSPQRYNMGLRNVKLQSSNDWSKILPSYMKLPIRGHKNPNFHTFVSTSHLNEVLKHSNQITKIGNAYAFYRWYIGKNTPGEITQSVIDDGMTEGDLTSRLIFIPRLLWQNKFILTILFPRLHYVFSTHFYGVQPLYGGIGFTEMRDNKVAQWGGEDYHTVLSPYEYIMFNHPVRSATTGTVIEVVNKYEDRIRKDTQLQFGSWKPDEYLGNKITVSYNPMINVVYANLKKNSMKVKVGDKIRPEQFIARVGCSGKFPSPYLFFSIQMAGQELPFAGNMRLTLPTRSHLWDAHLESRILTDREMYGDAPEGDILRRYDSYKINYRMKGGPIYDLSFVKQYPQIHEE